MKSELHRVNLLLEVYGMTYLYSPTKLHTTLTIRYKYMQLCVCVCMCVVQHAN